MIWNFCIARPVFTGVIFVVVAIFGVRAYLEMPVRENPDIDFPIVSVNVVYPGAEPAVLETEVIEPLEEEINTIEGLKELTSTAREQVAQVTAEFELWRDIDVAAQDVRDRVQRTRRDLPGGIEEPIVGKLDPDARAIMWIAFTGSDLWDMVELSEFAENEVKERLETIRGVGRVQIGGERRFAVRIRLDPDRLAAHRLAVTDVVEAIQQANVDIPSGRVESRTREFLVKTRGQFEGAEPFNDLIVAARDGRPVRLSDVGEAVEGVENDRQLARFFGEPAVGVGIVKQSGANTVALAAAVRERMEEIGGNFPPGITWTIATDDSRYIRDTIADLVFTVFLATGLVVAVVLGFLRTGWGTLITSLAIPTSLLAGLAAIEVLGFSLNVLTLMGLILAIGIVVDDAIVVLESSVRHLEQGAEPLPAARVGTTEVAFAAIANTLALAAVFVPVAFTRGIIGQFFYEFGLTVAITVVASTATALTLTPMLCARLLRLPEQRGRLYRASERAFAALEARYERVLEAAMRRRLVTVAIAVAAFAAGLLLFQQLSTEFSPEVDRAQFLVSFETPEGATLSETDAYARAVESALAAEDAVRHWFLVIGLGQGGSPGDVNEGIVFVSLTEPGERERRQAQVMQRLRDALERIPGGRAFVFESGGAGLGAAAPLQVVLLHPELDTLAAQQDALMAWMRERPQYVGVRSDLAVDKPQVGVEIDRDKARLLGVSVADIAGTLRLLLAEPEISEVERRSERFEVIPETSERGEMIPADLGDLYVRAADGAVVPLGNVARFVEFAGPSEIHHWNRIRAATVSASTPPGVPLGDALEAVERVLSDGLAPGVDYAFAGEAQEFEEAIFYLGVALVFSIVFIFLVLAAQFESLLHPLTILTTLPLATVGAFGGLWITGMTFNVMSFIGLIMLMGMVTKNSILLLDYANVLVGRGLGLAEAAAQAARTRFRPVLMTTVSTALGLLPIALGFGSGGESRAPLGVVVVVGLLTATALTLVVIPIVYTWMGGLERRIARLRGRSRREARASEAPAS